MSPEQLFILAVSGMALVVASRLVRARFGRVPYLEGKGRVLFVLAFLFLPPILVGALLQPAGTGVWVGVIAAVPLYVVIVAGLAILMRISALVVAHVATGRSRPLLMLALVGNEGELRDVPANPPMTARLAEGVTVVDTANAVFPRGPEFAAQIDRAGFRRDWDSLDAATTTLERQIADDFRLRLGVAAAAIATAKDARGRLDTLRRMAVDHGQAWAGV